VAGARPRHPRDPDAPKLKARQDQINARLAKLDKDSAAKANKDRAAESIELAALARTVVEADIGFKRKLVEAAGSVPLKDHQRRALERAFGPLPMKDSEDGAQAAE
jgi:hypothetical protein